MNNKRLLSGFVTWTDSSESAKHAKIQRLENDLCHGGGKAGESPERNALSSLFCLYFYMKSQSHFLFSMSYLFVFLNQYRLYSHCLFLA